MALGVEREPDGEEGSPSARSTIDGEDSIGLLRIMIAISCQVAEHSNQNRGSAAEIHWMGVKRMHVHRA